jgi:hypothetical protein
MTSKKPSKKIKTSLALTTVSWTFYVLQAVKAAKQSSSPVTLHVARESSASLVQDALMALAMNGEDAAWNVDVRLHKHIH